MRAPTGRPSCEQVQGPLETCEPQNGKNNTPKKGNKRLYRLASKKGIRAVPRESKNRTGPRMAPRRNTRTKRTHGQNRRNKTKRRGKTRKTTASAGGRGVLLDLSFVSSRRKKKKRDKTHVVVNPEPKTERTRQKKTRPDVNRIFRALPGRNCEKMREYHRRNHTKNTRTQKESKNKSSLPKIFRKNRPLEEENFAKKRQRTRTRPRKTQKKKNGQHFPLKPREEQAKNCMTVPALYLANAFV